MKKSVRKSFIRGTFGSAAAEKAIPAALGVVAAGIGGAGLMVASNQSALDGSNTILGASGTVLQTQQGTVGVH